jgi:hypothetical protein
MCHNRLGAIAAKPGSLIDHRVGEREQSVQSELLALKNIRPDIDAGLARSTT